MPRSPGFAAATLLTLALGIGLNTAVFSVVDGVLVRGLPYPNGDRLVRIFELQPPPDPKTDAVSPANFMDWAGATRTLDAIAMYGGEPGILAGDSEWRSVWRWRIRARTPTAERSFRSCSR